MNKQNAHFIVEHMLLGEDSYGQAICGKIVVCVVHNNCNSIQEYLMLNEEMLTKKEREYILQTKSERRLESFLLGRISAKYAYISYNMSNGLRQIPYSDIQIEYTCTGKPILLEKESVCECQLGITHSERTGIALVGDRRFILGIDIEWKDKKKSESVLAFFSEEEQKILAEFDEQDMELLFWSAKEALGKYLGIGLSANPIVFMIEKISKIGIFYEVTFSNFTRHKVIGYNSKEYVLSLAYFDRVSLEKIELMMKEVIAAL